MFKHGIVIRSHLPSSASSKAIYRKQRRPVATPRNRFTDSTTGFSWALSPNPCITHLSHERQLHGSAGGRAIRACDWKLSSHWMKSNCVVTCHQAWTVDGPFLLGLQEAPGDQKENECLPSFFWIHPMHPCLLAIAQLTEGLGPPCRRTSILRDAPPVASLIEGTPTFLRRIQLAVLHAPCR